MPAPEIDAGLADGTYKYAHEPAISGGVDEQGEFLTVPYYVPWDYRDDFIKKMLSKSSSPGESTGIWYSTVPYQYPGATNRYAFSARWQPTGTLSIGSSPIQYSDALVFITYRSPMFGFGSSLINLSDDPKETERLFWATVELDSSGEIMQLPSDGWLWWNDDLSAPTGIVGTDIPLTRRVSNIDISITFQRVPYMPRGIFDYQDTLNATTLWGQPRGTLLLYGIKTERKNWIDGTSTMTVNMRWKWRKYDWNKRFDGTSWRFIQSPANETILEYTNQIDAIPYTI